MCGRGAGDSWVVRFLRVSQLAASEQSHFGGVYVFVVAAADLSAALRPASIQDVREG